ncbi:MAG TPA: efflux RND transporter periplasmic adaptor subunit [Povalibacter sp.]|nr:efflux RND transporter periplasmic adaptor subunit [Povalibacter sp.]
MVSTRFFARAAGLVVSAACVLSLGGCSRGAAAPHAQEQSVPVVTAVVEERAVPTAVNVVGTVESTGSVILQSRVDGQITQVFVHDGQEVNAGQRLMQIDPAPFALQVRMAQATLARDEALLENAQAKAKHGATLEAARYLSPDDYTQLKTNMDSAAATVEQDRAALDNAKLQLTYSTITAPVSGKIGHIAQQVGNTVHVAAQTPLTTLNVLDVVDVSFALPEQQLAPVRQAMLSSSTPLQVVAAAVGQEASPSSGELSFIDNAADPTTGTIRLRARFDNRKRVLWPGQLVDVVLKLPAAAPQLVIPASAVSENAQGSFVFVIKQDERAEQRPVSVLRTADDMAIVSGVKAGERIVTDGQSRLTPNAPVRVLPAKASA